MLYLSMSIRNPITTLELFALGMYTAKIYLKSQKEKSPKKVSGIKLIIALCLLLLLYHVSFVAFVKLPVNLFSNRWISCIWQSIIGIFLAVFCVLLANLRLEYKGWLGRTVQFIARYEYGIYLCHMLLMQNFMVFQPGAYVDLNNNAPYVLLIIMILLAVFCGYISDVMIRKLPSGKK